MKRIAVIINPKSRATRKNFRNIKNAFEARGYATDFFRASSHQALTSAVRDALRSGHKIVVAAGGDGTVSAVATELVGTDAALGILPLGTYNNFAVHLGLSVSLEQSVDAIVFGEVTMIDVGKVNDYYFVNNSSIGLYPQMVSRREEYERLGADRFFASVRAIWRVLRRYPYLRVVFSINGTEFVRHTPLVFVGNGFYDYDGLNFGLRLSFNTGYLSLYILQETHRWDLFKILVKALFGLINNEEKFEKVFVSEFWIEMPYRYTRVAKDGEILLLGSPLHYQRVPGALKVLLPRKD